MQDGLVRRSMVRKPWRSAAAAENVSRLKRGVRATKIGRDGKWRETLFRIDADEVELSWDGHSLGKLLGLRGDQRRVKLSEILDVQLGVRTDGADDPDGVELGMVRTIGFSRRASRTGLLETSGPSRIDLSSRGSQNAGWHSSPASARGGEHLSLRLTLVGGLPPPPSSVGLSDVERPRLASIHLPRETLSLRCPDEETLARFGGALRCLLDERRAEPAPLGPSALAGAFGAPLEEVALSDSTLRGGGAAGGPPLLVPAALEALWGALVGRGDGLRTEGIFRVSVAEDELQEAVQRMQGGQGGEVLQTASALCLASLIKRYLRELPSPLWRPVRERLAAILEAGGGEAGGGEAAGGREEGAPPPEPSRCERLRSLLPLLPRRSADLVVWGCDAMLAVVEHEERNRMNSVAIASVMAPVLMRGLAPEGGDGEIGDVVAQLSAAQDAVRLCILLLEAHSTRRLEHMVERRHAGGAR